MQLNCARTFERHVAAERPPARIHDMRHLHVSLLILKGEDAKVISDRAGHSSTSFTLDRYAHVFDAQRKRAAHSLDDLLGATPGDDAPPEAAE